MKPFEQKRMLKLATYLEKLDPKAFDFGSVINTRHTWSERGMIKAEMKHGCGTVGCAMGHCVIVFPRLVEFSLGQNIPLDSVYAEIMNIKAKPELTEELTTGYMNLAHFLFGIPEEDAYHLFTPTEQYDLPMNTKILDQHAKPKEVAKMLRQYVEWDKNRSKKPSHDTRNH